MNNIQTHEVTCTPIKPTRLIPDIVADVRESLLNKPRKLSPKYFYDERGSDLFDQICNTPEYYPTRVENALLEQYSNSVIERTRPAQIIEIGSGYSTKTRHLFNACEASGHHCSYSPFDVCEEAVIAATLKLRDEYPWLHLNPLLGDYNGGLGNLPAGGAGTRLFVFLGSTIGNFEHDDAVKFIQDLSQVMSLGDYLLFGVDQVKKSEVLNSAYNDMQGITAAFNLNILRVLNKKLQANFNLNEFSHSAKFNTEKARVEMRLIANSDQEVKLDALNESLVLNEGEDILTEVSQKYNDRGIEEMLTPANLSIVENYKDKHAYFSLVLAAKK